MEFWSVTQVDNATEAVALLSGAKRNAVVWEGDTLKFALYRDEEMEELFGARFQMARQILSRFIDTDGETAVTTLQERVKALEAQRKAQEAQRKAKEAADFYEKLWSTTKPSSLKGNFEITSKIDRIIKRSELTGDLPPVLESELVLYASVASRLQEYIRLQRPHNFELKPEMYLVSQFNILLGDRVILPEVIIKGAGKATGKADAVLVDKEGSPQTIIEFKVALNDENAIYQLLWYIVVGLRIKIHNKGNIKGHTNGIYHGFVIYTSNPRLDAINGNCRMQVTELTVTCTENELPNVDATNRGEFELIKAFDPQLKCIATFIKMFPTKFKAVIFDEEMPIPDSPSDEDMC